MVFEPAAERMTQGYRNLDMRSLEAVHSQVT